MVMLTQHPISADKIILIKNVEPGGKVGGLSVARREFFIQVVSAFV